MAEQGVPPCPDYETGTHAWYTSSWTGITMCAACGYVLTRS